MIDCGAGPLWASLLSLAAAPASPAKPGGGDLLRMLWPFILVMAVFYFLMIRPQQKRQRQRAEMLGGLSKGDHVVTTGGIRGVITLVRDREVIVKVDDNVRLTLLKTGVARVVTGQDGAEDSSK
jgi:preprotein translocase subunit YajC